MVLAHVRAILNRVKHYKALNIMNTVSIIFNSLIQVVFYKMLFNDHQNNVLWSEVLIYVFFAGYLGLIMSIYRVPEFSNKISDGSYSAYTIRPISYISQFSLIEFGESINNIIVGFPLILIVLLISIYKNIKLSILEGILVSFFSMILSIKLTIAFYALTIFTKKNNGPRAIFQGITSLLSGSLVPLILWPENALRFVKILPFALIINSPIEVSLGNASLLKTLVLQLTWITFLGLINKIITERILCKQEHIGG